MVLHQLGLQNISWEDFISHEVFTGPQVTLAVFHEIGGPSHQQEIHETQTSIVPFFSPTKRALEGCLQQQNE